MIDLSSDQKEAVDNLLAWFADKNKPQFLTLGGYAGTGKTTLVSILRKKLHKKKKKLKVAFISFTGKATRVLQNKLEETRSIYKQDLISTIHSLIYSPIVDENEEIIGWERKNEIKCDLIIVDEASMVDQSIWNDLCSYNIPIIAVGDHGQLPPIRGDFNLMKQPNLRLEEIHRQAQENPIIKLSILARKQGVIPAGDYGENIKKIVQQDTASKEDIEDLLSSYSRNTFILCGYNSTRVKLNSFVRGSLEFTSPTPEVDDRVICLRNNHIQKIYNGMLGTIRSIKKDDKEWYFAEIEMDDSTGSSQDKEENNFKGLISAAQFNNPSSLNFTKNRSEIIRGNLFDFGYALTVHKAQGSQAARVILFEERFRQMDDEMWRRWLYTAVTRAEEELFIVGKD